VTVPGVTAVVVTHMRPRLAGDAVRSLVETEGFDPAQVVVVVNGDGGLDDPALEDSVRMVRLAANLGPAGGFRRGLLEAFSDASTRWAYLCEDDMRLLHLPGPRVAELVERTSAYGATEGPVGAVVAFGRKFVARSGHSVNFVPRRGLPHGLAPVDVSTWGATLVSRDPVDAGVLPDPEMFFGFEDFDFFSSLREAGFSVLVDGPCARSVMHLQTLSGRERAVRDRRPTDAEEPWRAYYVARNFFALARRHGRRSWYAWHLLFSLRRLQLAGGPAERKAILRGLLDGARGRLGMNPRWQRRVGEREDPAADELEAVSEPVQGPPGVDLSAVALVLSHNAPESLQRCLSAIRTQTLPPAAAVVVDNGSEPPVSAADLDTGAMPVRVLRSERNLGPAGGWALAFSEFLDSPFDHAWALDDDMVADPDCLEVLWRAAGSDPKRAFCFPWAVQPDGRAGAWGSWCGFLVSKAIVEQVGLPREELYWWAEDNEYLLWRIPHAGFERKIVDGAVVQHDAVRQGDSVPTWKYYYEARNMLYLHLHVMHRVGWYPRNVTKLFARAVLHERGARFRSVWAMVRGLVDGANGRLGLRFPTEDMQEHQALGAARGGH
jgi:rhamnopyranosyl-N-acetylglucosaminyl-diphospho-decaprenol beta-1,3/1,4-galactofuranosyltransferase